MSDEFAGSAEESPIINDAITADDAGFSSKVDKNFESEEESNEETVQAETAAELKEEIEEAIEDGATKEEVKQMIEEYDFPPKKKDYIVEANNAYDLNDIIDKISQDQEADDKTKKSATALFKAAKSWKVFAKKHEKATKISDLIKAGTTSILDLSAYSSTSTFNVRAMIIGLVSKKLFSQRLLARKKEEIESIHHGIDSSYKEEKEMPLVWLFLDEAHEFLPMNEKTPASNALIQLLREGRQPGISMVLATQQPGVIHRDVMTQSDIVLSHRLTNKKDL